MTQYQSSSGASPANSPTIDAMTQYQSSSGASPANSPTIEAIDPVPEFKCSKSTSPAPVPVEELSESSDGDEEDESLSEALFRRKPAANKGKKALDSTLKSFKQQRPKSTESSEAGDDDLTFSESLFLSVNLEARPVRKHLVRQTSPPLKGRKRKNPAAKAPAAPSILPSWTKAKNVITTFWNG
ncbi:hypothetical protein OS493_038942 [Desmophyllum pertusum]|uniref:Uncharacterized protein n=1 Tax=Desmophyllum pertusum TaxID=174260 RepID=A0A9W9ZI65_9CNID|nr:hypothetical protein OS493_038942 [Desmophyllum pertusum]